MTDEQTPVPELTRGEKMKRTRAANAKKKAAEAKAAEKAKASQPLTASGLDDFLQRCNAVLDAAADNGVSITVLILTDSIGAQTVTAVWQDNDWHLSFES